MAALIILAPDVGWATTGAMFDWTLEFLISRLSDPEAVKRLREIEENNLGSLSLDEFPPATRQEIVSHLRDGLIEAARRQLPDSDVKDRAVEDLQALIRLTYD